MDIPINAEVDCSDGRCGRSTSVVVNPLTGQVSHIVVRDIESPAVERMVPIAQVVNGTPDKIYLGCTTADMTAMDTFSELDYASSGEMYFVYASDEYTMWPYAVPVIPPPVARLKVPAGELAVRRGAIVEARDGPVGEVAEFLIESTTASTSEDPRSGRITHLVLEVGQLWGRKDVIIPVENISAIEKDGAVLLAMDREDVAALPAIPFKRWHRRN